MYRHLLVPVDDTEISARNVTSAIELARELGARITFFHATPDYSATGDGALMRAMSPDTFSDQAAGHARAILAKAEAAARAVGVACRCVSRVNDRPAQAILEAADREECDLIFIASRGPTSIGGIMLGSHTLRVLAAAGIPVLVSSVARNARHAARDTALAIIRDEHRSIAAVLSALRRAFEEAERTKQMPDTRLVRGANHYLRTFPETLHHPKEEQYLFARLRDRSADLHRLTEELERQHAEGAKLLQALAEKLDACERQASPPDSLREAVEAFVAAQWRHMQAEEGLLLPAAQQLLTERDWGEIADAFAGNADLRFDRVDGDFREVFARLMNQAPPPRVVYPG